MIRITIAIIIAAACLASNAEARQRHKPSGLHPSCNVLWPCAPVTSSTPEQVRVTRGRYVARSMGFGSAIERPASPARRSRHSARAVHRHATRTAAPAPSYAAGIVSTLAAKVAEIQSACGSRVISGVRHTRIAGTRRMSLHASGKAVDLQGNPSCMYAMLQGWQGGYSIDYARVHHLHLSFDPDGGREMGLRFRHGGHRYARRHHRQRHASARS